MLWRECCQGENCTVERFLVSLFLRFTVAVEEQSSEWVWIAETGTVSEQFFRIRTYDRALSFQETSGLR